MTPTEVIRGILTAVLFIFFVISMTGAIIQLYEQNTNVNQQFDDEKYPLPAVTVCPQLIDNTR